MARQEIVVFKCDMCGSEDNVKECPLPGGRVIDLCELDSNTLEDVLAPYVEKSVKAATVHPIYQARSAGAKRRTSGALQDAKEFNAKVREAAAAQGITTVKPRGRVPEWAIDAYRKGDWSKVAGSNDALRAAELVKAQEKPAPVKKAPAKKAPAKKATEEQAA